MSLKFKKLALLGLALAMVFAVAGCDWFGGGETTTTTTAATTVTTTEPPVTTTESTTVSTLSDTQKVQAVLDSIDLGDLTAVAADLTLPSPTTHGVSVTWSTSDADVITNTGEITVPDYGDGDASATLTATATLNAVTLTRNFAVVVQEETVDAYLNGIGATILITNADAITSNFLLPSFYGDDVDITWTSGNTDIATISTTVNEDGFYTVTVVRPKVENGGVNTTVNLTATIALGDDEVDVVKSIRVIAEPPATVYTSFETLHATAILKDYVDVSGVVYSTFKLGYFLVDDLGKYLAVYTSEDNANAVEIGDEVHVKGYYNSYNSLWQVSDLTYQEIISEDNTPGVTPIEMADANDLLELDSSNKLIHGQVYRITVTPQLRGSYNNVYLYQGEDRVATVYYNSDPASIDALEEAVGKLITINVTYYTYYNGSSCLEAGVPEVYVTYDGGDAGVYYVPLTGQDALDADYETLSIKTAVYGGESISLPAEGGYDSVISWEVLSGGDYASIAEGKLSFVDVTTAQTATVRATLTLDELTPLTKDFTITINPLTTSTIAEVLAMETGEIAQVQGIVYFFINNGYYLFDETGMLFIYTTAPAGTELGDELVVFGTTAEYKNEYQLTGAVVKSTVDKGNDYTQTPVVYEHGVSELVSGQTYTITATIAVEGSYNNVYLYQGDTQIATIYYRSTINDSYNALKTFEDKEVTFDVAFYYVDGSLIYFVYQEGLAGIEPTDQQKAKDDVAEVEEGLDVSVVSNQVEVLPTTATNGSTIAWALEVTDFASLDVNTITYEEVSSAQTVTLTATFSYPITGGDPIVTEVDYTITISTYEEKLAEDKTALTIDEAVNEFDEVTLPVLGANGSVITWVVTSGDATLDEGVVTYGYNEGVEFSVVLTATLTLTKADETEITDTKAFTVVVSPTTVLTDFSGFYTKTNGTDYDIPDDEYVFVRGVVTGNSYDGLFIQDVNGVGLFMYKPYETGIAIGDEVIYYGKAASYNDARQLASGASLEKLVDSGNTLIATAVTADQIDVFDISDTGTRFSFDGFTFQGVSGSLMTLGYTLNDGVTTGTVKIRYYSNWSDLEAVADNYSVGDQLPEVTFHLYNFRDDLIQLDVVSVAFTDADYIAFDIASMPAELILTENFEIPAADYGSTITITGITGDAATYIDYTTTAGWLLVTLPTDADKTGVITIEVANGSATSQQTTLDVTVKVAITSVYSTGFETSDGFTASTSYTGGLTANGWTVVEGTVTTTGGSTTDMHLQMRDYSTVAGFPSATYASSQAFKAVQVNAFSNQSSGFQLVVQFSVDGTTWSTGTTIDLTTTDTMFEIDSDVTDATYVRFTVSHSVTPDKQQVTIDDIVLY